MSEMVHIHRFECHGRNKEFVPLDEYRTLRGERDRLRKALREIACEDIDLMQARALALTALTSAGQRWTRSKPLQAGWYWYRDSTQQPEVLQVWNSEGVLWVDYYGVSLDSFSNGEWQGPLTPNEATE